MKKYKFILISNDTEERVDIKHAPLGWDKFKISHIKDFSYFGLFSRITSDFEFIFDGYDFLLKQFGLFDIDMDVLLRVYLKKDNSLIFRGKLNMEGFEIDQDNKKFKVDIIESSFVQDFKNREKTKYNIFSEGMPVASIRPKVFKLYSEGSAMEGENRYNHTLPIIWDINDNPQVKSGFFVNTSGTDFSDPDASFYHNKKTILQEISFSIGINAFVTTLIGYSVFRIVKYDIDNNVTILKQIDIGFSNTRFIASYSNTLTLSTGDRLVAQIISSHPSLLRVVYDEIKATVNEESTFSNTTCKCLLPHEAFNDLIYKMTGVENALVSNIFGRTDLGYDVDGEQALQSITKGTLLRNKEDDELAISFMDLFNSYNVKGNLGLIPRGEKVYIDIKDDLFEDYEIELGEVSDLKIKPAEDYLFNEITFGYPAKEYEELNGADEFNTTVNFTNTHRTYGKAFSLISKIRGDGTGAELARRAQESITGTKDTRYDNDLFFLCLERFGSGYRNERINTATGIFSPETSHNLRIAPSQCLNRWKNYFGIPSKNYTYQSKEFNSNLKLTIGGEYTEEGQDFVCDDRYFVPHIKEFNFPVTREKSDEIAAHPLGIIKYTYKGRKYYERLFEINSEDEGIGNFKTLATRITVAEKETLNLLKVDDTNYLKTDDDNYLKHES
jgi:hypothetical protein